MISDLRKTVIIVMSVTLCFSATAAGICKANFINPAQGRVLSLLPGADGSGVAGLPLTQSSLSFHDVLSVEGRRGNPRAGLFEPQIAQIEFEPQIAQIKFEPRINTDLHGFIIKDLSLQLGCNDAIRSEAGNRDVASRHFYLQSGKGADAPAAVRPGLFTTRIRL